MNTENREHAPPCSNRHDKEELRIVTISEMIFYYRLLALSLLLFVSGSSFAYAQACQVGNLNLNSQSQVDSFLVNYHDCEELTGTIQIVSAADDYITNLTGLASIKSISGSLLIANNTYLEDLIGLDNLEFVGGDMAITNNAGLLSLDGLSGLIHIGDKLQINANPNLNNLDGLNSLSGSITKISIYDNQDLQSIALSDQLLQITDELLVVDNSSLLEISGASALHTIENLSIRSNVTLSSLPDFESLNSIGHDLQIRLNPAMQSISGFNQLMEVGRDLKLRELTDLQSITGFNGPLEIERDLEITNNGGDWSLQGFTNLTSIEGDLAISENVGLTEIQSFGQLQTVGQEIDIFNNNELTVISGFHELVTIGASCKISNNNALAELNGFQNLVTMEEMRLTYNSSLSSLPNFSSLQQVNTLRIGHNGLEDLGSFSSLTRISNLHLYDNTLITDFSAFANLQEVTERLQITGHSNLNSLESLLSLDGSKVGSLWLYNCPLLSNCSIPFVCDFLSTNASEGLIYNNAPGCLAIQEIGLQCGLLQSHECRLEGVHCDENYQLSDLIADYPDCTVIKGDVFLEDSYAPTTTPDQIRSLHGDLTLESSYYTNVRGLAAVDSVLGTVNIIDNENLQHPEGLENLQFIGENLRLEGNTVLQNLQGLEQLQQIGGNVVVNGGSHTFEGLSSLEEINGFVYINSLQQAASLSGLDNLKRIEKFMLLFDNPYLQNLEGLHSLESIEKHLHIYNNPSLASLDAISNLQTIGTALHIVNNDALESLHGLDQVNPTLLTSLQIKENDLLSHCSVLGLCQFVREWPELSFIEANEEGCSSVAEIEVKCLGVSSEERPVKARLVPYPQPADSTVSIELTTESAHSYQVLSLTGQPLLNGILERTGKQDRSFIDVSTLSNGQYLLQVMSMDAVQSFPLQVLR